MDTAVLVVVVLLAVFVLVTLAKAVRIVPQARAGIVERLGRYQRTLNPGLTLVVPFIDRVLPLIDLREQVVSFPPQPVITQDNLVVSIDIVVYYQVNEPRDATYEISNYIHAIEQLAVTTLRNVIGGMDLERTLTSREEINRALRGVLDDATGKWGIRVNRVELKAIDPPPSIQEAMEKQMRADRDKRAAILNAEGQRQSEILTAEGNKQSAILNAEGNKQSEILNAEAGKQAQILKADGKAKAIHTVFDAIHRGNPDQKLLSYQYLQMLPQIAQGDANKLWIVPSEIGDALEGLGAAVGKFGQTSGTLPGSGETPRGGATQEEEAEAIEEAVTESEEAVQKAQTEVQQALQAAQAASVSENPDRPVANLQGSPDSLSGTAAESAGTDVESSEETATPPPPPSDEPPPRQE